MRRTSLNVRNDLSKLLASSKMEYPFAIVLIGNNMSNHDDGHHGIRTSRSNVLYKKAR